MSIQDRELTHSDLKIGRTLKRRHGRSYIITGRDGHMVTLQGGAKDDVLTFAVSRNTWGIPIPNSDRFHECDSILDEFVPAGSD